MTPLRLVLLVFSFILSLCSFALESSVPPLPREWAERSW